MAKDIKIYKGENEMTINETQLENFLALGWKQDKEVKSKKENKKWQHITEKRE
jgi:hypothetical protein